MNEEITKLNSGVWTDNRGITVAAWLEQWLDELTALGRSPKTLANYRGHVRDVWRPQLGSIRLRDLRRGHIEKALLEVAQPATGERPAGNVGRRVQARSPQTIEGYRRTIRAALSTAKRRGLIPINNAEGRIDALTAQPSAVDVDDEDDQAVWEPEQTATSWSTWPTTDCRRCTSWPPTPGCGGQSCAGCGG